MKTNRLLRTTAALLLCMGIFFAPAQVFSNEENAAQNQNVAPPTVHAEIIGSLLRIQTTAGFFSVEAVYINGRRFNHRVDSALVLDISQYIVSGDVITIHAVDFAGNQSNTVLLTPPPPMLPPQPNNITPEGQGEMIDHLTDYDGIEFFTINSRAGNVFYLVIDHTRTNNNVYFLNAVTEWDLMRLAEDAEVAPPPHIAPPMPVVVVPDEEPEPEPTPEPQPEPSGGIDGRFVMLGLLALAGVGAVVYVKFFRGKDNYNDDDGDGGDYEELNEAPENFEDE